MRIFRHKNTTVDQRKQGGVWRKPPKPTIVSWILAAGLATLLCSPQITDQGGGTDFPNTRTVTGMLLTDGHLPAANTEVTLVPQSFLATTAGNTDCCLVDSTDSTGCYSLQVADTGMYNLQATHSGNQLGAFVPEIRVRTIDDTVAIRQYNLNVPGAVTVALPSGMTTAAGYVAFKGTTFGVTVDSGTAVVKFNSLPSGMISSLYFSDPDTLLTPVLLQDSVKVAGNDTVYVTPELGMHHKAITLNTTPAGADVAEDVVSFPLVLRLGALGVPLGEMYDNGADLVITGSDFNPLPFEVELWDVARGEAVVWVLVDTIFGNSDKQVLNLFWGPTSSRQQRPTDPVFDTANGFAAVWHLDSRCADVTKNEHDGTSVGIIVDTTGVLAGAQYFKGGNHFVVDGLIDTGSTITLSAWAQLDIPDGTGAEVISLGDAVVIRMDDSWSDKGCQGSFFVDSIPPSDTSTHEYIASGEFLAGTGWHYLTYCVNSDSMVHRLYVDGVACCEATMNNPVLWSGIGISTVIGNHGTGKEDRTFTGAIDEVRVENIIRSAAWVRLCYVNQQSDGRLISVKE